MKEMAKVHKTSCTIFFSTYMYDWDFWGFFCNRRKIFVKNNDMAIL